MTRSSRARHLRSESRVPSMSTLQTAVVSILSCDRMVKVEASRWLTATNCSEFCITYSRLGTHIGIERRRVTGQHNDGMLDSSQSISRKVDSGVV